MLDISSDYEVFDNKENISFQNIGENSIVISNVIRRPANLAFESAAGTIMYAVAVEFIIWKLEAPVVFVPKLNAKITDNLGKIYNVDSIEDGVLRSRWNVKATAQASLGVN